MALTLQQLMIRSMHDTMQIYHLWDRCMDVLKIQEVLVLK